MRRLRRQCSRAPGVSSAARRCCVVLCSNGSPAAVVVVHANTQRAAQERIAAPLIRRPELTAGNTSGDHTKRCHYWPAMASQAAAPRGVAPALQLIDEPVADLHSLRAHQRAACPDIDRAHALCVEEGWGRKRPLSEQAYRTDHTRKSCCIDCLCALPKNSRRLGCVQPAPETSPFGSYLPVHPHAILLHA